jgi:hypothetical protein
MSAQESCLSLIKYFLFVFNLFFFVSFLPISQPQPQPLPQPRPQTSLYPLFIFPLPPIPRS